jgi:hypothetical protein
MRPFDVFLSHNSHDKRAVREVWEALRRRGLNPWLDEKELIAGRPWMEALEEVILTVPAAAVLIGRDGLGPWENREMRACLQEFVARNLPVIPVLLAGAPKRPRLPSGQRPTTLVPTRLRANRQWSPSGTVVIATFSLNLDHQIKYEREDLLVAGLVHLFVDGDEVFRKKVSLFSLSSFKQDFELEGVPSHFRCRTGVGFIFFEVVVGGIKVLSL